MTTPTIEAVSEAPAATAAPAVQTYELEALGRDIAARIKKGDKAKANADDLYLSAGLHLIEAKRLTNNFSAFLRDHCGGLSRSRADELIKIAEGAAEEVREKNRVRDRRRRAKAASVREPRTPVTSKIRSSSSRPPSTPGFPRWTTRPGVRQSTTSAIGGSVAMTKRDRTRVLGPGDAPPWAGLTLDEIARGGRDDQVRNLRSAIGWRLNLMIGVDRVVCTCPVPQHQGVELHTITMRQHDQRGVFIKCSMGHSAEHVLRAILGQIEKRD